MLLFCLLVATQQASSRHFPFTHQFNSEDTFNGL